MFYAPLMVALGNPLDFPDVWPVVWTLLWATTVFVAVVWAILLALGRLPRLSLVVQGCLVALALGAMVQGSLIRWNLGQLDGREKEWSRFSTQSRIDLLVWCVLAATVIGIVVRRRSTKTAAWISATVLILGCIQLTASGIARAVEADAPRSTSTEGETLSFHQSRNVVVVVLDSFQSDAFDEIRLRYPDEVKFLTGFRYFPDTVGAFPTTRFAIPSLLNGHPYLNETPFTLANQLDFNSESVPTAFISKGFGVVGDFQFFPYPGMSGHNVSSSDVREVTYAGFSTNQLRAVDAGLYRSVPLFLKKKVYDDGKWFLASLVRAKTSIPYPLNEDLQFAKSFVDGARVSSGHVGEFKFFHLRGVHHPVMVDEKYRYVPNSPGTRDAYVNQARGALLLLGRMLRTMERLGILDSAEVIVVGDHGSHNLPPIDMVGNPDDTTIAPNVIGQARPLLMYKAAKSRVSGLNVDTTPMHTAWIPCMLGVGRPEACRDYEASLRGSPVVRSHYRYEWVHDSWFADYAPTMTRYEVRGDARRYASWEDTGVTYPP